MSEAAVTQHRKPFNWRLLFAVLIPGPIAGMLAALILSVTAFASFQLYNRPTVPDGLTYYLGLEGVLFMGAFIGGTWGLLPMLVIGLPAHAWLMRKNQRQAWRYLFAACIAGVLFAGVVGSGVLRTDVSNRFEIVAWYLATGACAGLVAGLAFWLIRRPDRVSASPTP